MLFFAEAYRIQHLRYKSTHFLSYKHQNHQKIIQYSDNLTITHTIPHYFGCKVTSNPPNRTIWFVDDPLWFVNAAFCTSQHTTTVKNHLQFRSFSAKSLHNSNKSRTFASTELVCIPLELQASHFFIINYESESKNNSAADSHTQIKRYGFQRRKPRHLISNKNQLFPSKVLLDGYD